MQEILQRWLSRRPKCPGVLAWGLYFPGEKAISQCFGLQASAETLGTLWRELAEALQEMPRQGLETTQMRWVFSQHVIYTAARSEGAYLAVVAERNTDHVSRPEIENLLNNFKALRPAGAGR
jgi:hypothetical protein